MKKENKIYCNQCRYYIRFNQEINDHDICGHSIIVKKDITGEMKAELNDDMKVCEECNSVIEDNRKIKYLRCVQKNKEYNCGDFKCKTILSYCNDLKRAIIKIKTKIRTEINHYIALFSIVWFAFNGLYVYQTYSEKKIMIELLIPYVIISIAYFWYVMNLYRDK